MTYITKGSCLFIGIFFPIVGAIAVAARFTMRVVRKSPLLLDDWFSLIALIFTTGLCGMLAAGATHDTWGSDFAVPKANHPSTYGTLDQWVPLRKMEFAATILRDPAFGFVKLSILLFYRRIFDHASNRRFHYANETLIWLVALWVVVFFFTGLFQCGINFWVQWELPGPGAPNPCFNREAWNLAQCATDALMDILVLILPLPFVWALHMTTQKKAATTLVCVLGAGTVGISVVRVAAQASFVTKSGVLGTSMAHQISAISVAPFWFAVEAGVGQVVCCLPSLYPAVKKPHKAIAVLRSWASVGSLRSEDTRFGQGRARVNMRVRRWMGLGAPAPPSKGGASGAVEKAGGHATAAIPLEPTSPPVGLSVPTTHLSGATGTSGLGVTSASRSQGNSWLGSLGGIHSRSAISTASGGSEVDLVHGAAIAGRFEAGGRSMDEAQREFDDGKSVRVMREVSVIREPA